MPGIWKYNLFGDRKCRCQCVMHFIGYDGVFPPDIPVGVVADVEGNEADEFQTVVIALGAQYLSARHVTWLQSARTARIDSLSNPSSPSAP